MMAQVILDQVWKRYGEMVVVRDLTLEVREGEFVALVGPSGSGKSTALRMVAGLEGISAGQILIGDRVVNDLRPKDRDIAMVFQSYALYPHMSVLQNIAYGLKVRHRSKAEIEQRVREVAGLLDIEELLDRKPSRLSGGQQQRVALGRAIVREPQVFLMDEPLSSLDAKLRVQTRAELIKLHERLGRTTIYVTHDQVEAMTMADRIAVLDGGELQQYDTPDNLYHHPANLFVAGFIGSPAMNFLQMRVVVHHGRLALRGHHVCLPVGDADAATLQGLEGHEVIVGVRPEHVIVQQRSVNADSGAAIRAIVAVVENLGHEQFVYLDIGNEQSLVARMRSEFDLRRGDQIEVRVLFGQLHFFDPLAGQRLSLLKSTARTPSMVSEQV